MALAPGTRLGPYEITALIGEGGMGKVWRARHTALNRDDALKVSSRMVHVIESLRRHFGYASFRAGQEEWAFTPNFGSISSAQDSTQLQFAARFVF